MLVRSLLGKRDSPTDAVEDYCRLLGAALKERGCDFTLARVSWDEVGWAGALGELWRNSPDWKGSWVLAQYTALMWSRRGFPLLFLLVPGVLKLRKTRIAVVFHDPQPYGGKRFVDRARRVCQWVVMRWAYGLSDATVLTVPLEEAGWLPKRRTKATFIPIGANVPVSATDRRLSRNGHEAKIITVFGITDAGNIHKEIADIALAAKRASEQVGRVRLVTLGRGSAESAERLRQALGGSRVEFDALGILAAAEVSQVLADADVSLFVRGPISTQRGSAIASIANAVPLVSYANPTLPVPLAEAGVLGVPYPQGEELAQATTRVLTDRQLWCELHERSRLAHAKYFSWEAVASRFLEVLRDA
jgi:glycosyltransferase involved in cell wall biosynthesis